MLSPSTTLVTITLTILSVLVKLQILLHRQSFMQYTLPPEILNVIEKDRKNSIEVPN